MWFNINIDFQAIRKGQIEEWKKQLDKFADRVVKKVRENTPEDKMNLVKAINKTEQVFSWSKIMQQVKDTAWLKYTPFVEYWVWWREFRYNKPKWNIFFVWVWAAMFRKWYAEMKDKFNSR